MSDFISNNDYSSLYFIPKGNAGESLFCHTVNSNDLTLLLESFQADWSKVEKSLFYLLMLVKS